MEKIFEVIPNITTTISLIAFVVALIIWYLRHKTIEKRKVLENSEGDSKIEMAQLVLDDLSIDTSVLKRDQIYELAILKLKEKANNRKRTSILIGFLAIIFLIIFIIIGFNQGGGDLAEVKYQAVFKMYNESIIEREIKDSKTFRNAHCADDVPKDWRIEADTINGWYINTSSINIKPITRQNDTYDGITNVSSRGFNITGTVRNSGNCVRVAGAVVDNDARGKLSVSYSYLENKTVKSDKGLDETIKGTFQKGQDFEIEIPENTANYFISFEDSSGKEVVLSNNKKRESNYSISEQNSKLRILSSL